MEPSKEGYGVQDSILKSDGSGGEFLHLKAGGSVKPPLIKQLITVNILYFKTDSQYSKQL